MYEKQTNKQTNIAVSFASCQYNYVCGINRNCKPEHYRKPLQWKRYMMTCSIFANREKINELIDKAILIITTLPQNLRMKYLTKRSLFRIHAFIRPKDLREEILLTCVIILNRPRNFNSCHPPEVTKSLTLLRTNSSAKICEENINNFKSRLSKRGYPKQFTEEIFSEVKFINRESVLKQKQNAQKKLLPFVTQITHQCLT